MVKYSLEAKRNSNTLTLWLLMLVFLGPSLIAATLYLYRAHFQFNTLERGEILSPPIAIQTQPFFNENLIGKWQLIYVSPKNCDATCEAALSTLQKIQVATGKEQSRVEYRAVPEKLIPVLQQGDIGIIDPRGWLMMKYSDTAEPTSILKDLKRLLRLSHVG